MKWPEAMLGGHPLISMIDCLYHNILSYVKFIFHILWIQVLSQSSKRDTFEFFVVKSATASSAGGCGRPHAGPLMRCGLGQWWSLM